MIAERVGKWSGDDDRAYATLHTNEARSGNKAPVLQGKASCRTTDVGRIRPNDHDRFIIRRLSSEYVIF
jgi:hypothetical protein